MVIRLENRIHKVIKLDTGFDYIILKQAFYKNDNYYIAVKLDANENPLPDDLVFFHEMSGDKPTVEEVTDKHLMQYLYSYMQFK